MLFIFGLMYDLVKELCMKWVYIADRYTVHVSLKGNVIGTGYSAIIVQ